MFNLFLRTLVYLWWGTYLVSSLDGFVGKEGVCSKNTLVTKTSPDHFWVTQNQTTKVKCGPLGLRKCNQTEVVSEKVKQPVKTYQEVVKTEHCCEGYSQQGNRCMPVCNFKCLNGVCTAPDHCTCIGGYIKKKGSQDCEPQCLMPCGLNQVCSAPGVCSCRKGFEVDEEDPTKCHPSQKLCIIPCDHGYCPEPTICTCLEGYFFHKYEQESDSRCEPICSKDCVNATCTSPEHCTCLDGYRETTDHICIPNICEKPCVNGYCSKESKCVCKKGYKVSDNDPNLCEPVCSKPCVNGMCINPEECTCLTNYAINKEDPYLCEPVCKDGCINGVCSSPGVCTCKEGYKTVDKENICEPICDEDCVNGFCSAPNTCACVEGFENDPLKSFHCRPVCSKPCLNASCTAPETCSCYSGYEKELEDDFRCLPVCHEKCVNAECSDPEVCLCLLGFVKDPERPNICLPFCSKGCENGVCESPETCSCNAGYKVNPTDPSVCDPECSQGCLNGFCSSPEVCSCTAGYEVDKNDKSKCYPVCKEGCKNGICTTPDNCTCNAGYEESGDPFTCNPHCTKPCINGVCASPDFCECFPDHKKDLVDSHICNAACEKECVNGYCKTTNVCECRDGFFSKDNPYLCEPKCSSCSHGICESPEVCRCEKGYKNPSEGQDTCEPICEKDCINGTCVEPDICGCSKGYVADNATSCHPHCIRCDHGECKAPNKCYCHPGYKKNNETRSCEPVCDNKCKNGVCIAPNSCSCLWGFEPSYDKPNECEEDTFNLNECSFKDNFLKRNYSDICFSQDLELKLTDWDECMFLTSIVLKYFNNDINESHHEVSFDCILNYLSDDEEDLTLLLRCKTENITNTNAILEEERKEFDSELADGLWLDESEYESSEEKADNGSSNKEASAVEEKATEGPPARPKIFVPPLLPSNIKPGEFAKRQKEESGKNEKRNILFEVIPNPSPIITELEKHQKKETEPEVKKKSIAQAYKDVQRDIELLKQEVKEMKRKEKERKEAEKLAKLKLENKTSQIETNVANEQTDETDSNESDENSEEQFILRIHHVPKNIKKLPVVIKINHLNFIRKEKITEEFFKDITDVELLAEWCLCLKSDTPKMCLDKNHFKMTLCPCKVPEVTGAGEVARTWLTYAIIVIFAGLQVCFVRYFIKICRKWREKKKKVSVREFERNSYISHNHIQVQVDLEDEIQPDLTHVEDSGMSSSKL